MKNKVTDLNNHLFEQLERLNDDDLVGDALLKEIDRSKAMSDVAGKIIENAQLVLKAQIHMDEFGIKQNGVLGIASLDRHEKDA